MAADDTRARTRTGSLDELGALTSTHLQVEEYDALIQEHGNAVEYRRSVMCPCVRIDTRTPEARCPECKGLGYMYPEHLREDIIVLDTQRNATLKLVAAGKMTAGTVQLTFPSGFIPAMGDMVLPTGEEHVVQEQLWVESALRLEPSPMREFRVSADHVPVAQVQRKERLLYPRPCCIESVAYFRGIGAARELVHANESDYHVDIDGRWTWLGSSGPEAGHAWSVRYRAPAVYVVHTSAPTYRSEAGASMPYRVVAHRLDKVSHEDLRT